MSDLLIPNTQSPYTCYKTVRGKMNGTNDNNHC